MKKALDLTRSAFPCTLVAAMLLSGCTAQKDARQPAKTPDLASPTANAVGKPPPMADAKKSADKAIPTYETVEQVLAMPLCKATVEHKEELSSLLKTTDGKKFGIGSDRGAPEVWHFLGTLKEGQAYEFPAAFVAFEKRKLYATADEIKAMPPCKASVDVAGPCFSVFTATDGKIFVIGDPGSKPVVYHFLGSLVKGHTYEFPIAFIDYQKDHPEKK